MAVAVVDSNVLIDYKDTSPGSRTRQAADIVHAIERHEIAVDLRDRLSDSAGFELVHSAQKDFHRAVELFEAYGGLSFGDATIAAYMEREDIEYLYSFDDDFDVLDTVTRLATAENPFS